MFPVRADVPCGNSTGSSCNVGVSGVPAVGVLVRRWPAGHGLSWTQQSTGNENGIAEEYDSNHAKSVYLSTGRRLLVMLLALLAKGESKCCLWKRRDCARLYAHPRGGLLGAGWKYGI